MRRRRPPSALTANTAAARPTAQTAPPADTANENTANAVATGTSTASVDTPGAVGCEDILTPDAEEDSEKIVRAVAACFSRPHKSRRRERRTIRIRRAHGVLAVLAEFAGTALAGSIRRLVRRSCLVGPRDLSSFPKFEGLPDDAVAAPNLFTQVTFNGAPVAAILDTGAGTTLMSGLIFDSLPGA